MMKRTSVLILAAIILAVLSATAGWFFATKMEPNSSIVASAPTVKPMSVSKPAERKVLYWADPMVPGSRFDKPGKSPFMDMELEPVYADENTTDIGTVKVNERALQNLSVRIVKVEDGQLAHRIETVGMVKPDEHRVVAVHAHTAGWIEKVYVRAVGDPVRAGQPMFELYSPDLVAAQEEYLLALRHHDSDLINAAEQKLHLLYFHGPEMKKLQASQEVQKRVTVYAPTNGVVSELMVRQGMAVTAGQPAYTLTNLESIWVNAQITEAQAPWVINGMQAEIYFAALPNKTFKGKVEYIYPEVAEVSRTLSARIQLQNGNGLLKPNMVANVILSSGQGKTLPLVPRESVIETGTRKVVIVADGGGKFHAQNVVTGSEVDGKVEILEGLGAGLDIVASGQFMIDSEANLKSALDRMQSGGTP
jgi:membrane fusion protein, copper/silver efflux system